MWGALIIFVIVFVIIFVIISVIIPVIIFVITFVIIFVQGELEVTTEAGTGKAKEPNAAGQVTNVVDRVPFLFLGLDLPAAPLYKDVMETNIIPQVWDATAVDLSACIVIYLHVLIHHHLFSNIVHKVCTRTLLFVLQSQLVHLGPKPIHAGQCCCIMCTLCILSKNQEHKLSACNTIYSVAHHPMFKTCDVHCIKVCCSVTTQDTACQIAWHNVEMQCSIFIVSYKSPDLALLNVN